MDIFAKVEFWQAISAFAWPVAVVIIALLFRKLVGLLVKRERLTIKVAGMEISVAEATEQAGKELSDLQERIAALEARQARMSEAASASASASASAPASGQTVEVDTSAAPHTDIAAEALPMAPAQKSILWVDDYPSNNAFIIEKLERDGIRIRKELSTDAAMKALGADSFDLVISDLGRQEGGINNHFAGLELARAMRAAGVTLPLLIYAGQRGVDNRSKLLAAGVTQVTASPVDVFKFVDQHLREI